MQKKKKLLLFSYIPIIDICELNMCKSCWLTLCTVTNLLACLLVLFRNPYIYFTIHYSIFQMHIRVAIWSGQKIRDWIGRVRKIRVPSPSLFQNGLLRPFCKGSGLVLPHLLGMGLKCTFIKVMDLGGTLSLLLLLSWNFVCFV